jgi:hypothetical protein
MLIKDSLFFLFFSAINGDSFHLLLSLSNFLFQLSCSVLSIYLKRDVGQLYDIWFEHTCHDAAYRKIAAKYISESLFAFQVSSDYN